ncbi:MAG: Holliday junction branch migration protein RuvA [Clostridia bacterium]|nr:Holliday junction branch migration protein RuvA [Clostridia bacterium]
MFYYISGGLAHLEPNAAVVDAGGVGYYLTISQTTHSALPHPAVPMPQVKLYTYMAVREDAVDLFGFATNEELSAFKLLISVSGVGPKAAISILSLLTPEKFALAVCSEDTKTLSRAQGVGAKTAARIVLELKDKLLRESKEVNTTAAALETIKPGASTNRLTEAQDALIVLGYTRGEALTALRAIDTTGMELEDIIRAALKKLMK